MKKMNWYKKAKFIGLLGDTRKRWHGIGSRDRTIEEWEDELPEIKDEITFHVNQAFDDEVADNILMKENGYPSVEDSKANYKTLDRKAEEIYNEHFSWMEEEKSSREKRRIIDFIKRYITQKMYSRVNDYINRAIKERSLA